MKYFLDTEFIEDGRTIDLISLGVAAEDGRELYCISEEFNPNRASKWVAENVLAKLEPEDVVPRMTRKQIRDALIGFAPPSDSPEFWGYFSDYDWVAVCQLFGAMIDLPKGYPFFCRDLQQELAERGLRSNMFVKYDSQKGHHALRDARHELKVYSELQKYLLLGETKGYIP